MGRKVLPWYFIPTAICQQTNCQIFSLNSARASWVYVIWYDWHDSENETSKFVLLMSDRKRRRRKKKKILSANKVARPRVNHFKCAPWVRHRIRYYDSNLSKCSFHFLSNNNNNNKKHTQFLLSSECSRNQRSKWFAGLGDFWKMSWVKKKHHQKNIHTYTQKHFMGIFSLCFYWVWIPIL